mmetsp:Transcript_26193/g.65971  ORF Transcript_26193/g.65971 Transcript_26193/m.65971 type:complete len:95 (+) Transcript_26193:120-404(+)|eukprot:g19974.t1
MLRLLSLLFAMVGAAFGYKDILTHGNAGPVEVINVAIESAIPDAIAARRAAEMRRSEAASLANLARRRSAASSAISAMISMEKLHEASMRDLLG